MQWATVALVTTLSAVAQSQTKPGGSPLPSFEDYSVTDIFRGTPVAPKLVTPRERNYRTMIREGVTKAEPNFAGHYIVVRWNCGSPCNMMAIVDARSGIVHPPPIESEPLLLPPLLFPVPGRPAGVEFRRDSNLMIVRANPNPSKGRSYYTHYFVWKNDHWILLLRVPLANMTP